MRPPKKRKSRNPDGRPLRVSEDTELARIINEALMQTGVQAKLKELAKAMNANYQAVWGAYNGYRKLSLRDMLSLFACLGKSVEEAVEVYMRQPAPTKGLKEKE
jgi:hypothetical protein